MSNDAEVFRKQIHDAAKKMGVYDNRNPSRLYCGIIINHMAEVLGIPVDEISIKIREFEAKNQGSKS